MRLFVYRQLCPSGRVAIVDGTIGRSVKSTDKQARVVRPIISTPGIQTTARRMIAGIGGDPHRV